ncbi:hypothetical protein ACFU51_03950 [Streptomyces sp. NPDC057430]|uniref:hypothetical protein n=1 Tax=Streptomyces sp. NPDC057430 TaxID=3346131 RepID=UPI003675C7BC
MDVVALLLLLVAASALWAVLRLLVIYPCRPGEWQYAFGAKYHQKREDLRRASRDRGAVLRKSSEDLKAIDERIAEIDSSTSERVQVLEQQRQKLLNPPQGERVDGEGELELYERSLVFLEKAPEGQELPAEHPPVPLAGLEAKTESDSGHLYIVVTWPCNRRSATYPLTKGPEVRRLVDAIYTAVQQEEADCGKREREAADIIAEIQRIRADAATQETEARSERAERIATQHLNQQRADAAFQKQCDNWAKDTGRRPHSWWQW